MTPLDFTVRAKRWVLVACISALLFVLGIVSEYAREQSSDNERLRHEALLRFQEQYSGDIKERIRTVEIITAGHAQAMTEFRESMKEFSHTVSDHGLAVHELAQQVRVLGNKVEASARRRE